jgi:hypothetical protein
MSEKKQNPDEWWAAMSPLEQNFFRDVIWLAEDLLDREVLRLTFNGRNFSPVLVSRRSPAIQPGRAGGRMRVLALEPEEWWGGLHPAMRKFVRELAGSIEQLQKYRDEFLEIVNTGNGFKAALSVKFSRPTGGKAETN